MLKDSFIKGLLAGLLGTIGDVAVHWLGTLTLKTTNTADYIARLMFPIGNISSFRIIIGLFTHFIAGSLGGVLLVLLLKYFGRDYAYYKGIGLAFVLWIFHVIIIPNIINSPRPIIFRTEIECIIDLLAHITFGIIATAYLIKNSKYNATIE